MRDRFGGLPSPLEAEGIWHDIWREEAHNSTAIEGNTLIQSEVDELLEKGIAAGRAKFLTEYLEVRGYADAADWVYKAGIDPGGEWTNGALLTMQDVRHVHSRTVDWVWRISPPPVSNSNEGPGCFREHEIEEFASGMKPCSWVEVSSRMTTWVSRVNRLREPSDSSQQVAELAALHSEFERIHPFLDGNGRSGRLLLNLLLVRLGMPPAVIYQRERARYLRALNRSDAGDHGALTELLSRAVLNNLNRLMLPALAGPARIVPLAALANAEISHGALRSAASRGALRAQRNSVGEWESSQKFVDEYVAQRGRHRGRPRLA